MQFEAMHEVKIENRLQSLEHHIHVVTIVQNIAWPICKCTTTLIVVLAYILLHNITKLSVVNYAFGQQASCEQVLFFLESAT